MAAALFAVVAARKQCCADAGSYHERSCVADWKCQQENIMPMHKPRARLTWRGKDTVREILSRLHKRERTLVTLPAGFHHALTVSVSGNGEVYGPVDAALDDAAFDRLVRIRGLRELAELREPLAGAGMDVRVCTPPPRIRLVPRDTVTRRKAYCYPRPVAIAA
jgi:hypothetical protein